MICPVTMRNAIFDLDGTLVDSSGDILHSLRAAYFRCGLADLSARIVDRSIIGPPLQDVVKSLSPEISELQLRTIVAEFRDHYDRSNLGETTTYVGIDQLLSELVAAGVQVFVATNKPSHPTQRILQHLRLDSLLSDVITPDCLSTEDKSKREMLGVLIRRWNLETTTTFLVGDSPADIVAAHAWQLASVGVLYGYGRAEQIALACPTHLAPTVESLRTILRNALGSGTRQESRPECPAIASRTHKLGV